MEAKEEAKLRREMAELELKIKHLKTQIVMAIVHADEQFRRFEKMETAPATSGEPVLEPPFEAYMKHPGTDEGLKAALRLWKDGQGGH